MVGGDGLEQSELGGEAIGNMIFLSESSREIERDVRRDYVM
jgi:hypothetical protein